MNIYPLPQLSIRLTRDDHNEQNQRKEVGKPTLSKSHSFQKKYLESKRI